MSEYTGECGTIYITETRRSETYAYEVWFEDFHIIGQGHTELEALRDAALHAAQLSALIASALAFYAPVAKLEESDSDSDLTSVELSQAT